MILCVRVTPNAGRDAYGGRMADGTHRLKLRAPAVDGKANKALIDFLADRLGVSRSDVIIRSGETARRKRVEIRGIDPPTAIIRLEAI